MANVKYGGGVVAMAGSVAGTTHARNRFGYYVRARTKPVNPNTSLQIVVRLAIANLTQYWHDTMTPAQRIAWATYAGAVSMKNKLGETIYLTGFNMFIRSNVVRVQLGQNKTPAGPTVLALPEGDPTFSITASAGTQLISVTWDPLLPWCSIPASVLGLWMGQPQLATRNFFNGPWKNMGSIPGNQVPPQDRAPSYTLVLGQRIWVYSRTSSGPLDSRLSEPMVASCTVLA